MLDEICVDENLAGRKKTDEKMLYENLFVRKSADEKMSDEKLLDEEMSRNRDIFVSVGYKFLLQRFFGIFPRNVLLLAKYVSMITDQCPLPMKVLAYNDGIG